MPWLALTLEVDAGEAEAVSEALLEAQALSVSIDNPHAERCRVSALLAEDVDARALMSRLFAAPPRYEVGTVADDDWVRRTQAQFPPMLVGKRLWIGPSWCTPPGEGRAAVTLDPGLAFGTGTHPSTRLALGFIERTVRGGE